MDFSWSLLVPVAIFSPRRGAYNALYRLISDKVTFAHSCCHQLCRSGQSRLSSRWLLALPSTPPAPPPRSPCPANDTAIHLPATQAPNLGALRPALPSSLQHALRLKSSVLSPKISPSCPFSPPPHPVSIVLQPLGISRAHLCKCHLLGLPSSFSPSDNPSSALRPEWSFLSKLWLRLSSTCVFLMAHCCPRACLPNSLVWKVLLLLVSSNRKHPTLHLYGETHCSPNPHCCFASPTFCTRCLPAPNAHRMAPRLVNTELPAWRLSSLRISLPLKLRVDRHA